MNKTKLILALAALMLCGQASADDARQYHIPAQSLNNALLKFSADSGVEILFAADKLRGFNSGGLDGNATPAQALSKLLQGSGMTYRFVDAKTVTVEAPPSNFRKTANTEENPEPQSSSSDTTLPKVTVEADTETDPYDPVDTNHPYNKSYSVTNAITAAKTDTPTFDTPVSVQVIPKALIQDQQAIGLENVLKNVSGISKNWGFGADANENIYIRGFANGINSIGNIYRDGVLTPNMPISLANTERVEVLKGPSAMLFGRAQPGGLVNIVTKRPRTDAYYSLQQQFGSYDTYRTLLDATNKITEDGTLAYRVNYEHLESGSFRNNMFNDRDLIAPSLTWKITNDTQLDFDFIYQNNESISDSGIPYDLQLSGVIPGKIPFSFTGNEPTDYNNKESFQQGVTLTHRFNDDWKVRAKFSALVQDSATAQTFILDPTDNNGTLGRGFLKTSDEFDNKFGTIDVTGRFDTGPVEHHVLLGADYYNSTNKNRFSPFRADVPTIIIFDPKYGFNAFLNDPLGAPNIEHNEWYGLYVQDQLSWNDTLHLMLGGRFDNATFNNSFGDKTDDDYFSPRIGLMYHPTAWLGAYVNYVKGFNAFNSGTPIDGSSFDPEQSKEMEFGLKGEWLDGKLKANLAFFELTKSNLKSPLPAPLNNSFATIGKARSQGIEFDVQGQLTEDWNLIATYTYLDTKVLEGLKGDFTGVGAAGNRLENIPRNTASVWTAYDFSRLALGGLSAGAGVYLVDSRQGNVNNSYTIPGYTRVDAMVKYQRKFGPTNLTVQFNIENLLDKKYIASSNGFSEFIHQTMPSTPRTFLGSIRIEY